MRSEPPELARPLKRCFLLFGHLCRLFLGPGFRLGARWNRLAETVKTRKTREKTGDKMGEIRPKTCKGVGITCLLLSGRRGRCRGRSGFRGARSPPCMSSGLARTARRCRSCPARRPLDARCSGSDEIHGLQTCLQQNATFQVERDGSCGKSRKSIMAMILHVYQ